MSRLSENGYEMIKEMFDTQYLLIGDLLKTMKSERDIFMIRQKRADLADAVAQARRWVKTLTS